MLIANRGECAVRLIRACQELGIETVAIYSEADAHAVHVKKADRAVMIGPDPVRSYLNIHRIVDIALEMKADAVHPGYGFLSENADFAEAVLDAGLVWVGPRPEAIRAMGDKTEARRTMQAHDVPVVPGSDGPVETLDEALRLADAFGYPVMLKAAAGGGGRGIRRCDDAESLRANYELVRREAKAAFGDDAVFLEKCIVEPRHIEFQILADRHGQVVHLFERDCSIQRRHQKLIEIAPSLFLDEKLRAEMGEVAVRAARAVGYENAGTVEFLVDRDRRFYFMEMNTRLQVEHPITEAITGIDLVEMQIRIAAGERVPFAQEEIRHHGVACEFRINAEDPKNDFLPTPGRITRYFSPGGPGVRVDGAVYPGYEIPPHYDSMIAKLTVWAPDWPRLVARAKRALSEYDIRGVRTTIPFYRRLVADPLFLQGDFTTGFLDQHPEFLDFVPFEAQESRAVAIAAAIAAHAGW